MVLDLLYEKIHCARNNNRCKRIYEILCVIKKLNEKNFLDFFLYLHCKIRFILFYFN